jgi:O-antigen/teichoic acid export membrane protein
MGSASVRRLFVNYWYLAVSAGVTALAGVLITLVAARYLGVAAFGEWGTILAITSIMIAVRGGGGTYVIRETAKNPTDSNHLLTSGLTGVILVCALISVGGFMVLTLAFRESAGAGIAYWLAAMGMVACCLVEVPISMFVGKDRMVWRLLDGAQGLSFLLLLGLAVWTNSGLKGVAAALCGSWVLVTVMMFMLGKGGLPSFAMPRGSAVVAALTGTIALGLVSGLQVLHWNAEIYLLQLLRGSVQVGLFSAAFKMFIALRAAPWLLSFGLLPTSSRLAARNNFLGLRAIATIASKYLTIIGLLVSLFLLGSVEGLVHFLFGSAFADSAPTLKVLIWGIVPLLLQFVYWNILVSLHEERKLAYAYLFSLLGQVMLDLILIPTRGAMGAACSYALSEWVLLIIMILYSHRHLGVPEWRGIAKPATCFLLVLALAHIVRVLPTPRVVLLQECVYCLAIVLTGTVVRADLDLLKGLEPDQPMG